MRDLKNRGLWRYRQLLLVLASTLIFVSGFAVGVGCAYVQLTH
jgi:hypothetical protein